MFDLSIANERTDAADARVLWQTQAVPGSPDCAGRGRIREDEPRWNERIAQPSGAIADVYSAAEIAAAAGVRWRDVRALVASGVITPVQLRGRYFSGPEAVRAVRWFSAPRGAERPLFRPAGAMRRRAALPVATSTAVHVAIAAIAIALAGFGSARPQARNRELDAQQLRFVFLVAPGPGGGGGGGGRHEEAPPPPAERKAPPIVARPAVIVHRPPPRIVVPPVVRMIEPPRPKPDPLPPVVAPVIPVATGERDRIGLPVSTKDVPAIPSRGPGAGEGVGSGHGSGLGEGDGTGIGPGSGGGTGGGPYRPGSGVTAPTILREVRPDYTEEGRRRGIEGDVDVEIVVRSDGSVGSVKLLQGLGAGLDERAMDAVQQWRFSPATRLGAPVDVIVEVAVEFKLR